MKPPILHDHELNHLLTLEKGQTFMLARPMEPQPTWDPGHFEYRGFCDDGTHVFYDTHWQEDEWVESPFGPPGTEFFVTQESNLNQSNSFKERLFERFHKIGDCWEWFGIVDHRGYGRIRGPEGTKRTHRASWVYHNGSIPEGKHVLHKCDVRWCVNPGHLYLGDHIENAKDKIERGRQPKVFGENNQSSKIKDAFIPNIIELYDSGMPQHEIGDIYGVSQSQISRIINKKRRFGKTIVVARTGHRHLKLIGTECKTLGGFYEGDWLKSGVRPSPETDMRLFVLAEKIWNDRHKDSYPYDLKLWAWLPTFEVM